MSVHDQIVSSASENARLLAALAEVDYAPAALKQQSVYLADLHQQIRDTDALIKRFSLKTSSERKDHEKYRDSTVRRFAYKLGGKKEEFIAKAGKEEREYLDALQDEINAKGRRDMLSENLDEANKTRANMETAAKRHAQLQAELDALYNSIFGGPTPEFPEEDAKEEPFRQASRVYDQVQQRLKAEQQAASILLEASKIMQFTLNYIGEALQYSKMDMYGLGGGFADYAERSALSRAEMSASQVQMLVSQAQRIQPAVQQIGPMQIGPMQIAQGHLLSDILFDNIFFDISFHQKIESSARELLQAKQRLTTQLDASRQREGQLRREIAQAARRLDSSRKELQRVRQETFERVTDGSLPRSAETAESEEDNSSAPPPGYLTDASAARPPAYSQ